MCESLILHRVNPDKPFVLRVDASKYAVGAALEQLMDEERCPTKEDVLNRKNGSRSLHVTKIDWVTKELGPPGTRNLCHHFGPTEIGKLDRFTRNFGTNRT